MDRNKRFVLGFFACFLLFLALAAGTVFVLDPFHYHAPSTACPRSLPTSGIRWAALRSISITTAWWWAPLSPPISVSAGLTNCWAAKQPS